MENPIDNYWKIRLEEVKETLEANHFKVFLADNGSVAKGVVLTEIIAPGKTPQHLLGRVHDLYPHRPLRYAEGFERYGYSGHF